MQNPFTIIIPHFNDILGLKNLLQTLPQGDICQKIVVDDNSTKNIEELHRVCSANNVELYVNTSGVKGAGACRNIGIQKSVGKWLIFADADDFFTEHGFDNVKSIVNNKEYHDCDIIYFKPTSIFLDSGEIADRHLIYDNLVSRYIENKDESLRYQFFVPWSKIIKRDFVVKNSIEYDEVIASNDIMFSVKIGHKANAINVSDQVFYCVTRKKGSLTTQTNRNVKLSRLKVLLCYNKYLHDIDKHEYQDSVLSIVKEYSSVFDFNLYQELISLFVKSKLPIFPRSYKQYIFNPSLLRKRILTKKSNSHKNIEYLD